MALIEPVVRAACAGLGRLPGEQRAAKRVASHALTCLLYTSPSPRDKRQSRMPSSA